MKKKLALRIDALEVESFAAADAHVKGPADLVKGMDAAIRASTYSIEHAGQTAFLAMRADVDADGTLRPRIDTVQGSLGLRRVEKRN